ncbi:MAG: phage terminase small subunit P27 family [Bilophila sp.]
MPTQVKLLRGTAQRCRMNPDEPAPDPSLPDAPTHLSPEAREEWDRVAGELYDLGVLSAVDRAALAAYCQAYGRWVAAERELRREDGSMNLISVTSNGNVIQNPLVGIANKSLELMHKYLTEFGMSPSSRTRVGAKKKTGEKKGFAAL